MREIAVQGVSRRQGHQAFFTILTPETVRRLVENALEPKAPPPDESDIYSKPVEQKEKLEEWKM